jgi:hypothetical protein
MSWLDAPEMRFQPVNNLLLRFVRGLIERIPDRRRAARRSTRDASTEVGRRHRDVA